MIIRGVVETGVGDFGKWIAKLSPHYRRKTGLALYPGTLNVRLPNAFDLPDNRIRLEADEYGGTVSANIVPCTILGRHAVILRTDANDAGMGRHPREVVEVATDVCLREIHDLHDGDMVSIEIDD
ncbi:DUF120 domain-containing protein [Candidatus Bipolaricaulota bacterium]